MTTVCVFICWKPSEEEHSHLTVTNQLTFGKMTHPEQEWKQKQTKKKLTKIIEYLAKKKEKKKKKRKMRIENKKVQYCLVYLLLTVNI